MRWRNMKVNFKTVVIAVIIILAVGMFIFHFDYILVFILKSDQAAKDKIKASFDADYAYNMNTMDDLVKYADLVIVGTVVNSELYNKTTSEYTVKVEKTLKGQAEANEIKVYEITGLLDLKKKYLLFLNSYTLKYVPHIMHTSIHKDGIFEVKYNVILADGKFLKRNERLKEMIDRYACKD